MLYAITFFAIIILIVILQIILAMPLSSLDINTLNVETQVEEPMASQTSISPENQKQSNKMIENISTPITESMATSALFQEIIVNQGITYIRQYETWSHKLLQL